MGEPRGIGEVIATRQLAGFDQVLVLFAEDGISRWVDWRLLRTVASVEMRAMRRAAGRHEDHAERFRLRALARALTLSDENTGAFGRLDIDPLPHQMHVAHKVVSSPVPRWLIADDVGLGKTIEVGLILHALTRRNRCRRVLVVCPAGLTGQWKQEMRLKFDRFFEIWGRDFKPEFPEELRARDQVIVSLDLAKQEDRLALLLEAGRWDAIVFDEAHRLSRSENGETTARFRLAEALRERTHAMLLLTATPHQGKSARFGALLELARPDLKRRIRLLDLDPSVVGEIVIRNRKTKVTDDEGNLLFRGHDVYRIRVTPSAEMTAFDKALRRYLAEGYRRGEEDGPLGRAIGFVMTTYRKLASSSLAAIEVALVRRLERLGDENAPAPPNADETENDDALGESPALGAPRFFEDEDAQLRSLIRGARHARGADAKLQRFLDEIADRLLTGDENLLVFSEYRATQAYLAEAIAERFPQIGEPALINGSMSLDRKTAEVARFDAREARVMISTEAGGEGLNLHSSCHVMVNYDLPWNPSRLVQRIGRLYRYGQTRRVQVFNLQADDGFDNQALSLMLDRVEVMARDLAGIGIGERAALESDILGDLLSHIDMEEILERSSAMRVELTATELDDALKLAAEATTRQNELLDYASGHEGPASGGFDGRHMLAFVEGMAAFLGIAVRQRLHGGAVLELDLPDTLIGTWPEFRRRGVVRVTADRRLARSLPDVVQLDFETGLVRDLASAVIERDFDGRYGETCGPEGLIALWLLRWQDPSGEILEEELVPIRHGRQGGERLAQRAFANMLLSPLPSSAPGAPLALPDAATLRADRDRVIRSAATGARAPASAMLDAALRYVPKD
jgi:superfamily II DNA or RNA helicase